ncbi:MarR family transcriptional regulator [Paraburkholderia sp. A1RO-5L]|uniref:MarR family transcriptional regulator n=1 Tax=unclassified Paraburkholderia TaxID=2615204 RepID=UPI003B75D6F1
MALGAVSAWIIVPQISQIDIAARFTHLYGAFRSMFTTIRARIVALCVVIVFQNQIARALNVSSAAVSKMVPRLLEAGLVRRRGRSLSFKSHKVAR